MKKKNSKEIKTLYIAMISVISSLIGAFAGLGTFFILFKNNINILSVVFWASSFAGMVSIIIVMPYLLSIGESNES